MKNANNDEKFLISNVEIHGPFQEYFMVTIEGYMVPYIKIRKLSDSIELSLDDRFCVTIKNDDADAILWFIANAMAISAGFTSFGEHSKRAEPFRRRLIGLSNDEMKELPNT